jgi:hypothetical protein
LEKFSFFLSGENKLVKDRKMETMGETENKLKFGLIVVSITAVLMTTFIVLQVNMLTSFLISMLLV